MPVYLIVGALTRDITEDGFRYGGSVLYAGLTALALGYKLKVVTTCHPEEPLGRLFPGAEIYLQESPETTTFVNLETTSGRRQQILANARPLKIQRLPQEFLTADIVHLAPVADECPLEALGLFSGQFVGASIQGWLRTWDKKGLVRQKRVPPEVFSPLKALVLSQEDVGGDLDYALDLARIVPLVVVTRDRHGAWLYHEGQRHHLPAPEVSVVDPCGAGDIFAAVFFSALFEGLDPLKAVALANCLAARSVTRKGLESIALPEEIRDCYQTIAQQG